MCQWIKDVWSAREKERDQLVGIGRHHATRHESRPSSSPVSCPSLVPSPDAIATYTGLYQWHSSVVLFIQPRVLLFYLFFFSFSPLILILPRCCCDLIASDWQQPKRRNFFFFFLCFLPFLFAYLREVNRAWKLPTYTQHSRVETHVPVSSLSLSEVLCGRWNFCLFEMCDSPDRRGERRRFLSTFFFFPPVIFDMAKRTTDIPPLGVCVWKHFHDAHTHTQDFWCAKEYIVVRQLFLSLGYTLVRAQSGPPEIFSCYWTAVAGWCGCVFVANGTRWSMMMVKGDIALVVTKTRHANIIDGRREGGSRNCCPNISLSGRPSAPA